MARKLQRSKKNSTFIEFACNFSTPKERKNLLCNSKKVNAKNSDVWIKYVFREAYSITSRDLNLEFIKFLEQVKGNGITEEILHFKQSQILRYKELVNFRPLDDKKIIKSYNILL